MLYNSTVGECIPLQTAKQPVHGVLPPWAMGEHFDSPKKFGGKLDFFDFKWGGESVWVNLPK